MNLTASCVFFLLSSIFVCHFFPNLRSPSFFLPFFLPSFLPFFSTSSFRFTHLDSSGPFCRVAFELPAQLVRKVHPAMNRLSSAPGQPNINQPKRPGGFPTSQRSRTQSAYLPEQRVTATFSDYSNSYMQDDTSSYYAIPRE